MTNGECSIKEFNFMNVLLIHKNRKLKTMKDYRSVNICSVMHMGMRIARCYVFLGYIVH